MAEQTVAECLTAATDSVTLINDINTNGNKSPYAGGRTDADGNAVAGDWEQADINAVVFASNVLAPKEVLLAPVVFTKSAFLPIAVLRAPVVLVNKEFVPNAELSTPVLVLAIELFPTAVLAVAVVLPDNADVPTATLECPVVFNAKEL